MNQINGKIFVGEELMATIDGHWVRALTLLPSCYSLPVGLHFFSLPIVRIYNWTFRSREIHQRDEMVPLHSAFSSFFGHVQDNEVFIHEKRSGQQETLWNPSPDIRSSRLKRQVVYIDQQGEFESER